MLWRLQGKFNWSPFYPPGENPAASRLHQQRGGGHVLFLIRHDVTFLFANKDLNYLMESLNAQDRASCRRGDGRVLEDFERLDDNGCLWRVRRGDIQGVQSWR